MKFDELTQVALLGTERQPLSAPVSDGLLAQLQAQVDFTHREEALLATAALSALHERIGTLPGRDLGPGPQPCAEENCPRMNDRTGSLLLRILSGEHVMLAAEFLELAARANQVSPPEALPGLLALATSKAELRADILPVLGARGRWLAAQNDEWSWVSDATGDDEGIWQIGETPARLMFLQRLRRTQPARARELLASTWGEETPDDRAQFIVAFGTGLSLQDESFLEAALDDKRKEVRRAAAGLLAQLPDSSLVKRMIDRSKPLLKYVPGETGSVLRLKKGKPPALEVALPAECDKAMQRDGIEPKPGPGLGEKAWWLMQILERVPLETWTRQWSVPPADLLAASQQGEWKKEFLTAWTGAAVQQKNAVWADLLFAAARAEKRHDHIHQLLSVMSPAQREGRLAELLDTTDLQERAHLGGVLAEYRNEWSLEFSRIILTWLRRLTAALSNDWALRNEIKNFAPRLAPALLADIPNGWPTAEPAWEFWAKGLDEFLATTQFRADMHAAFTP